MTERFSGAHLMTFTAAHSGSVSSPSGGEQRTLLHNVRWVTYEQLLADLANQSSSRLTYNQGILEIMTPSSEHEEINRRLELLIDCLALESGIELRSLGSTTFRRPDLERGFEPDSCFYIQSESCIRGKRSIDLSVDPPPDLIVEIDITRNSMNKFPIYAQIGVPEVWHHDGNVLQFHKLAGQNYTVLSHSLAFPMLTSIQVSQVISQSVDLSTTRFFRAVQEWVKAIAK